MMIKKCLILSLISLGLLSYINAQSTANGAALNFDGNDDYVISNSTISLGTIFTIEAKVNITNAHDWAGIITSKTANDGGNIFQLGINGEGKLRTEIIGNTALQTERKIYTGTTVLTGAWHHVATTFDGTNLKLFVDGVEESVTKDDDDAIISFNCTRNIVIGAERSLGVYFEGSIDDARIWSEAKTVGDMPMLMKPYVEVVYEKLVFALNFNEGLANGNNAVNTKIRSITYNGKKYGKLMNFNLAGNTSNFVANAITYANTLVLKTGVIQNRFGGGVSADFNGDGFKDIIGNDDNGLPIIYFNNGSGGFIDTLQYLFYTNTSGHAAADIDNDGDVDFVCGVNGAVKIFLNDGTGHFTDSNVNLNNGGGNPSAIYIMDINNDNVLDIAWSNGSGSSSDHSQIWLNTGTINAPTFTTPIELPAGANSLALGDIDNDSDIDVVIGSEPVKTYLNNANAGTFTYKADIGGYVFNVMLADWDKDGDLDYLVYSRYNSYGLRVRKNDGAGNFGSDVILFQDYSTNSVKLVDLNRDGFLDMVADLAGGNGMVYLNDGCKLTKQTSLEYALGSSDSGHLIADFNNDGIQDIFCKSRDGESTMYLNHLDATIAVPLSNVTDILNDKICINSPATLSAAATNDGTLRWYSDAVDNNILSTNNSYQTGNLTSEQTYYVAAINANNCESDRVPVKAIIKGVSSVNDTTCSSYEWFGKTYSQSGNYTHTIPNVNGCDSVITLNLKSYFVDTSMYVDGNYFYANAYYDEYNYESLPLTYQWVDCNNNISPIDGAVSQEFYATKPGAYAIVIDNGYCSVMSAIKKYLSPTPNATALNFDGTNDYVVSSTAINLTNHFTVEAKINVTTPKDWAGIITSKTQGSSDNSFQFGLTSTGTLRAEIIGASGTANERKIYTGSTVLTGNWHHVAMTFDGTNLKLFVDGVAENVTKEDDDVIVNFNCNRNVIVGSERSLGVFFEGTIDDARIWSVTKLEAAMQNLLKAMVVVDNQLELAYNFNEGISNGDNTAITVISSLQLVGNNTGNLNNFTLTGNTSNFVDNCISLVNQAQKAALNFDGVDDYVVSSTTVALNANFTVEAKINITNANDWTGVVTSRTPGTSENSFQFGITADGRLLAEIIGGTYGQDERKIYSGTTTLMGDWHHVAMTFDGTNLKLYVDGIEEVVNKEDDDEILTFDCIRNIVVGAERSLAVKFSGSIDDARIWSVAKSESDMQTLMKSTVEVDNQLLLSYDFNEGIANGDNTGMTYISSEQNNGNNTASLYNFTLTGTSSNFVDNCKELILITDVAKSLAVSSVNVYPNPSAGVFNIQTSIDAQLAVYNTNGEKVYHGNLTSGNNKLNLQNQNAGLYIFKIISAASTQNINVILMK
jgi:hypothetical protein